MTRGRVSSWLVRSWVGLVVAAIAFVALLVILPSDGRDHFGVSWLLLYGLGFVLAVAILGLPLLIVATILDRRST